MPPPMTRRMRLACRAEVMSRALHFTRLLEGHAKGAEVLEVEGDYDELVHVGGRGEARVLESRGVSLGFRLREKLACPAGRCEVERQAARRVMVHDGVDPLLELRRATVCASLHKPRHAILNFAERHDAQIRLIAVPLQ